MKKSVVVLSSIISGCLCFSAAAQVTMSALTSFGGGDGWLAPGEGGYAFLGTASNERGLAFGNNHLYLVSRNGGDNNSIFHFVNSRGFGSLAQNRPLRRPLARDIDVL